MSGLDSEVQKYPFRWHYINLNDTNTLGQAGASYVVIKHWKKYILEGGKKKCFGWQFQKCTSSVNSMIRKPQNLCIRTHTLVFQSNVALGSGTWIQNSECFHVQTSAGLVTNWWSTRGGNLTWSPPCSGMKGFDLQSEEVTYSSTTSGMSVHPCWQQFPSIQVPPLVCSGASLHRHLVGLSGSGTSTTG